MNFFDSLISEAFQLVEGLSQKSYPYEPTDSWNDVGYNGVILQRDTAFELDGVGFNLITAEPVADEVVVIGKDLRDITENTNFVRLCVISLEENEEVQKTYNLIRKVEYTKYHVFPEGYMTRTSSRSHKEAVRVSKNALASGIDFKKIGSLLINKYKDNEEVKGVRVMFITDSATDFKAFEEIAHKNNDITEALNHVMNSVNFDCDTCKLKPVCDEVEGMKELHFGKSATNC